MASQFLNKRLWSLMGVLGKSSRFTAQTSSLRYFRSSRLCRAISVGPKFGKMEQQEFITVFPDIVRDLTSSEEYADIKESQKWLSKVLQYNLPGGRKNRGLTVVQVYQQLTESKDQSPEKMRLVRLMGWTLEMLHTFYLMNDDLMDDSATRRQRTSWHKNPEVGIHAINDAVLINASIFELIKMRFGKEPYYLDIMDLFHEALFKSALGSALDIQTTAPNKKLDLNKYTMNCYNTIVKYKYIQYSFYLPLALAMHMAGIDRPELFRQAKTIVTEIGHYFQVEMDYLDCFGGPDVTWVKGTDIRNGKVTWLIVMALQRVSPQQRKILEEHYGNKEGTSVAIVKALYEELGLKQVFKKYSEDRYQYLDTIAHQTSKGLPQEIFLRLMNRVFHDIQ